MHPVKVVDTIHSICYKYNLCNISFLYIMLTQFKKIIAVMVLFASIVTQISVAGAWTTGDSSGSTGTTGTAKDTNSIQTYCDVFGCNNMGGNSGGTTGGTTEQRVSAGGTTSGGTAKGTGASTGDVFGGSASAPAPQSGTTGTAKSPSDNKTYCEIYGCKGVGNGGIPGSSGWSTGSNSGNGTAKPTGSSKCDIYTNCTSSGNTGSNNGNGQAKQPPAGIVCDIYSPCQTETPGTKPSQPGHSLCNDHYYPNDIDGHWAEIYVRRLYDLCILEGYADGSFRPQQNITRAELTKMALYAAGIKPNPGCYDADCGSPFMDLDMWQGSWIRPAWDRHIVQGYTSDRFAPNRAITRAEATKVILAAYGFGPLNTSTSFFNDVWDGAPDGSNRPTNSASSRVSVTAILTLNVQSPALKLQRSSRRLSKKRTLMFSPITGTNTSKQRQLAGKYSWCKQP